MTKISVIMAEYNTTPQYLRESIESILSQTFRDFDFIIIDDCGTNNLAKIVESYADPRIKIVRNRQNSGLVASLNTAIEKADGEYLVRMDTDDIAMPNRIETLYKAVLANPEYAVIGSRAVEFSDRGEKGILSSEGEKTGRNIMRGDVPVHPSVIMKKEIIKKVGGYPSFNRAEDLALWCELVLAGQKIYVLDDVLLRYRVNDDDYTKRKLRNRKGEIKVRMYYYPKLGAGPVEYFRVVKSIIAGVLPAQLVNAIRRKYILKGD